MPSFSMDLSVSCATQLYLVHVRHVPQVQSASRVTPTLLFLKEIANVCLSIISALPILVFFAQWAVSDAHQQLTAQYVTIVSY